MLLHGVLGFHTEDVSYPYLGDADSKLGEDEGAHETDHEDERALTGASSDVDGLMHHAHGEQAYAHAEQSEEGVEGDL